MSGWNQIQQVRILEERADKLGLKFAPYRHDDRYGANVALIPKDLDALPIYTRDADVFVGTLEGAAYWMQGVEWAREYDRMVIDRKMDAKRARKEQDERNLQLMKMLKDEKLNLVKT
ncbi:MAG: hypothetical protein EBY83_08145 [Verrucomicrobia bacterium]|nr:hypothetical protein [Verrucomicrobiota bacterium]